MASRLSWNFQKCAAHGWYFGLPEMAVYTALGGRFMSTQPSTPSFKAQTRALLKKVHPDLFHDNQEAREANERSFKLLQEYLAAAKTGGGIGRTAGLPYHFTFYIREQLVEPQEKEDGESSWEASELRRVALTLPPPSKTGPGDSLSPSTRKAFARLLEACGIPAELPPEGHERHYSKILSLREFLPQAAEQVHQAATQQAGPRQQLGAVRTALRLGRNTVLSFAEPASSAGPVQQLALAQQLLAVLDSLPEVDVSGLRVTVGEAYGVDALGTIWLHAGDSLQAWARYLENVDTAYCHERQALQAQVRKQEVALARLLRVPLVCTHPQVSLDLPYLDFLQRTTAAAADRGPIGEGRFNDVPVMVHPDPAQSLDGEETDEAQGTSGHASEKRDPLSEPSLDDAAGVVLVPVAISPADLYSAMARLGPAAQAVLRRTREEEKTAAALRTAVERNLRLRRLIRDPGLAPERFRAACLRLMHHSTTLQPLLEGLAVRVAEVNGLPPDRSFVDVAWDFEL